MIHFDCSGPADAEVLLLSSGLGGAGDYWQASIAALAQRYRVVTYDQRGTGRSPANLAPPHAVADMADDAAWVLDAVGARSCRFIGHALGGLIGVALAALAPGLLSHLVVVNGWMRADPHTVRCFDVRRELLLKAGIGPYLRAQPLFLYPSSWMAANAARLAADEAHAAAHFPGIGNTLLRIEALLAFDAAPLLPALACRTLLVVSHDDLLVPPAMSRQLHEWLPGSRLARLDGGHACNVTDAGGFDALCLEFLAG